MAIYEPIDPGVPVTVMTCGLETIRYDYGLFEADFWLAGNDRPGRPADPQTRFLRVGFDRDCIVRLIDELPQLSDDDGPLEGIVLHHFSYRVRGAAFPRSQPLPAEGTDWFAETPESNVSHFRFFASMTCLDVLCAHEPTFTIVNVS